MQGIYSITSFSHIGCLVPVVDVFIFADLLPVEDGQILIYLSNMDFVSRYGYVRMNVARGGLPTILTYCISIVCSITAVCCWLPFRDCRFMAVRCWYSRWLFACFAGHGRTTRHSSHVFGRVRRGVQVWALVDAVAGTMTMTVYEEVSLSDRITVLILLASWQALILSGLVAYKAIEHCKIIDAAQDSKVKDSHRTS